MTLFASKIMIKWLSKDLLTERLGEGLHKPQLCSALLEWMSMAVFDVLLELPTEQQCLVMGKSMEKSVVEK